MLGHKTFYDGGKSENYPYPLGIPFPPGQQLTIQNSVALHLLSLGIKTEYRINKNFNVELNTNYCFQPKQNGNPFRSIFSTVISSPTIQQGADNLYYADVNPDGIINTMTGINCNLSNKFKIHFLYLRTINGVHKYLKDIIPFKYRLQYAGIALQLSYNFLDPHKGDDK